jgi:predicted nucleic acid-binding protein
MIVVADSGPLHYLILLDQIELLHRLYGQVVIPDEVAHELCAAAAPQAVSGWIAHLPEWATVTLVSQEQIAAITDDLDLGERAAIALAGAIRADLLLIDDAAGRVEAKRRNLRVTGTLGVLRAGAEQGVVDVPDMLQKLRTTSFYADEAVINLVFHQWLRPT